MTTATRPGSTMSAHPTARGPAAHALPRRALALLLAMLIALPPVSPAFAQKKSATDDGLADEPIGAKIAAKPNVMMTVDDSGSMNWDFLPDQTVGNISNITGGGNYCRDASGAMTQACGGNSNVTYYKMFTQTNYPVPGALAPPMRSLLWAPAGRVPAFNGMAYNPAIEYKPPLKATFDPSVNDPDIPNTTYAYPEMDSAATASWTKVPLDGFGILWPLTTTISMNNTAASGQITVGRWCNTDWPLDVNSGDECRINGKAYSSGSNGVPAVVADWNYPLRPAGFDASNTPTVSNAKPKAGAFHYTEYAVWCNASGYSFATANNSTNAAGTGTNCRRNNTAYTASPSVSAKFDNYPDSTYKYRVTQGTDSIPNVTTAPWHYWRGNVEWCKTAVPAASSGSTTKWQGYGQYAAGSCQGFADSTYKYPRFYKYMQSSGYDNVSNQALELVALDFNSPAAHDASYVTTIIDSSGNTVNQTISQTRDFSVDTYDAKGTLVKRSEMTNFANWFAYYRSRIQAAKTVTTRAFGNLDKNYRVGFGVFNNVAAKWLAVNDFDVGATQRANWFTNLTSINPSGGTPTFAALTRVGEYFAGASSPITYSCQKNWHVLFTDGYANDTSGITGPAATLNVDGTNMPAAWPAPSSGVLSDQADQKDPSLVPGNPWPYKYREGTTAQTKTLADFATYYWKTDLKTSGTTATNNVPTSTVPPLSNLDEYAISIADPASWQHVNFAAISFGARGTLDVTDQKGTLKSLSTGATRWPAWVSNGPQAVDDLWHAAINGHGRFVNASNPDQLAAGLARILLDVAKGSGSRVGVGFSSVTLSATNNYVYKVRFEEGWGGTLKKVQIDPTTGNETGVVAWSAADQLAALLTPSATDPTPWLSDQPATARKIVTMNGSTGVPFRLDKLSSAQQLTLAGNAARQQLVLEFLRGSSVNESDDILGRFRVRSSRLGDIVNSQPVYVGPNPKEPYLDATDPGYSTFKATSRAPRVYVGANDGMLHAFDDVTGREVWAYVPKALFRDGSTGLAGLSYQEGGVPIFHHHFYVDSTPRASDVYVDGVWKTILVGGLGKGGNSYYALDVTTPGSPATEKESDIAAKVLWEFTDPDMGYTYGRPLIVKTYAYGWVMIVPSGYNNPSGVGKVFVVDLKTGTKLKTFTTSAGTAAAPSGLAHISGYTKDHRNQYVEQVYGGDLLGNLWRFDLSDPNPSNWQLNVTVPLAQFSFGGKAQPITTPPQIEVDIANGVDRWVFIGTGRLLDNGDLDNTDTQSFYAIRDGTATQPKTITSPVTRSTTGMVAVTSKDPLASRPAAGWYDDLPAGQRIVTPVQAEASIVAYSSSSTQTDVCATGLPASLYAREYSRGGSRLQDSSGGFVESIDIAEGAAGIELIALQSGSASGVGVPDIKLSVTQLKDGTLRTFDISFPPLVSQHRMSWRLLRD
jgi:type IV pilus assembly protein PilY1